MKLEDELVTHTISLTNTHFSQALDLYAAAKDFADSPSFPYDWIRSKYASISSIIHSYSALESVVSETGHCLFFAKESYLFTPPDRINYTLRKTISNWSNTTCLDKLSIIAEQLSGESIAQKLINELRELNNLRNWIAHGFVFQSTLLLQEKGTSGEDYVYDLVDREDSVDWAKKFPNTKFSPLDEINLNDARIALVISLSAVLFIYQFRQEPFALTSYYYGPFYSIIEDATIGGEKALASYIQGAKQKSE